MSLSYMSFWEGIADIEGVLIYEPGTFDIAFLQEIMSKFCSVVKLEALEEIKETIEHFASIL
ncbi:MAG TPA: hypothetical protein GX498_03230 [Clostridiales bacterium]|nr:hypothetical protein [Clostridiales bacterium]